MRIMVTRVCERLRAVAGVICLVLAAGLALVWFWVLAPTRHLADYNGWLEMHSRRGQWEEAQREIHRFAWKHDTSGDVGSFGGKEWVEWILKRARPGGRFDSSCADGHKDSALCRLTNQDLGTSVDAWLQWWSTHREQSQSEWIADGFSKRGIDVNHGLTPGVTRQMLLILGDTNRDDRVQLPRGLGFNAFRWLRDHEFDGTKLTLADFPEGQGDALLRGLIRYYRLLPVYPSLEPLLIRTPDIGAPWLTWVVCAAIALAALAGAWLLGFFRRMEELRKIINKES